MLPFHSIIFSISHRTLSLTNLSCYINGVLSNFGVSAAINCSILIYDSWHFIVATPKNKGSG
jgi:hypothetical protein